MVIVEPSNVVATQTEGRYELLPYLERRGDWGFTIGIGASSYQPVNYQPDQSVLAFDEVYKAFDVPMAELTFSVKRNYKFGSVGGELGVGFYKNDSDNDQLDSSLQLIPLRLGGVFYMDALAANPVFVPYVSGGAYMMMYKETTGSVSFNGNTQVAPYVRAGMAFGLDWIDKDAARVSYEDSGIQSTFAYLDAGKLFASGGTKDPDFEDTVSVGAGFRIEF